MNSKVSALLAAAVVATAPSVLAQSSSSCSVSVFSDSDTYSKDAFVKRGTDIAIFLCDQGQNRDFVRDTISEFATDTAMAVARASVRTSVDCEAQNDGGFSGSVSGSATATASASAAAIYEGFLTVNTCSGCDASAELLLSATEEVFVTAVAEFADDFDNFGNNANNNVLRNQVTEDVEKAIIDVYVDVLINVRASLFSGPDYCGGYYYYGTDYCDYTSCFASITTRDYDYDYPFDYSDTPSCVGANIRGGDDENTACCSFDVEASAFADQFSEFVVAALEVFPTEEECANLGDGGTIASGVASAVASTFASAFTFIRSTCQTQGSGNGCAITSAFASAFAFAFADAFADVFIDEAPCGCERLVTSRDDFVSAFGSLFSSTFTSTFGEVCSENDGEATAEAFNDAFEFSQAEVVAQAVLNYFVEDDTCTFSVDSVACVGAAGDDGRCFGFDGQKRCPNDQVCVLRDPQTGFCFESKSDAPRPYLGTVLPACPEGDDYYFPDYDYAAASPE